MSQQTPDARTVFFELLDAPVEERAAILAARCSDAPDLAAEVSALLEADAKAEGFLEPPRLKVDDDDVDGRWLEGRRIGKYTVGRRIGIGGMGTVYVAEQDRPRRSVALKLLRSGLGTADVRRRFEREVEILGRLRHSGIAEIYEAGTHESELGPIPFFALEYIPGALSVTRWAEQEHLDVRARVALAVVVCDAVAHAHEHGIVHRDIKPNNILVGTDGRPRLIDFGIARWSDDAGAATLGTQLGDLLGTLRYMSPEQCDSDGAAVGPPSDVYALGVVMYELVAGALPYPIDGVGAGRIAEFVRTYQPTPPTRAGVRWRALDAVILMALAKTPQERYATAGQLRDDLERALNGEPVHAKRSHQSYRARRLLWRSRRAAPWLAVGGVVAIGLAMQLRPQPTGTQDDYGHRVAEAEHALATGDLARAKAALAECPAPLRGWEWQRMSALVEGSVQVLEIGSPAHAIVHDPARGLLIAPSDDGRLSAWRVADDRRVPRFEPAWKINLADELGVPVVDARHGVIYVFGETGGVYVRDLDSGDDLGRFGADGGRITAAILESAAAELLLLRAEGSIERWDLQSRTRVTTTPMPASLGPAVADHNEVFAALAPEGIVVFDTVRRRTLRSLPSVDSVEAILVEGDTVYAAGWDDRITVLGRTDGKVQRQFEPQPDGLLDLVRLNPNTLASAGRDGAIVLWDVEAGAPRQVLRGHDYGVDALVADAQGQWLASASLDGTLRIWDAHARPLDRRLVDADEKLHAVAFSTDGALVLGTAGPQWGAVDHGLVMAWSTRSGKLVASATDQRATVDAIAVSPDGQTIATASRDGEVVLRNLDLGARARFAAHSGRSHALAFGPNRTLATGGDDGSLAIWSADDGSLLHRGDANVGVVEDLAWTSDGLVVGGALGVSLCSALASCHLANWRARGITAIVTLADGTVVTGSADGTLARIDLGAGESLWSTPTFGRTLTDVAVSPDGTRLATTSQDYGVRLIDVATGAQLLSIGGHESVATATAFSPQGGTIASAGYDRVLRLWDAPTPSEK